MLDYIIIKIRGDEIMVELKKIVKHNKCFDLGAFYAGDNVEVLTVGGKLYKGEVIYANKAFMTIADKHSLTKMIHYNRILSIYNVSKLIRLFLMI